MHEKDLHEKTQLAMRDQNPLKYVCFFFFRKQLATYYFHTKLLSQIIDMVLNPEAVAQRCFVNKVVLQISENSQEKTYNRGFLKKRPWHRCFSVNFQKFVRTTFLQKSSGGCFRQYASELLKQHLLLQFRSPSSENQVQHFIDSISE